MRKCNICCFIYSRFRTICGQEMQVAVLWLLHACYHVTLPRVWHLTLTRLGQIPVTQGFQTTRTSSATCPSTIFHWLSAYRGYQWTCIWNKARVWKEVLQYRSSSNEGQGAHRQYFMGHVTYSTLFFFS